MECRASPRPKGATVLTGTVVGVPGVVHRLDEIPRNVRAALAEEINRQTTAVLKLAKENADGPRPSHIARVSSKLYRAINMQLFNEPHRIVGTVGIKLKYAPAHEFGIKNMLVSVRAHNRRNLHQMKADERRRINRGKEITHDTRRQQGQGVIQVRQHDRLMQMPERSFLRAAIKARKEAILTGIQAAIEKGIAKSSG